jgi:cysteine desulfuration protein SufE
MTIEETEKEIVEEFSLFEEDWESRYEHLIDLGKTLPLIDPALKTPDRIIEGCQSQVWLDATEQEGKMYYSADSDAIITRGMVALIIRVLSGQEPAAIVKAKLGFVDEIGLKEHLSPTRANGLISMISRMKMEAVKHLKK